MFNGPSETLTETEHTQPALLLSSIAAFTMLAKENISPIATIGHSLGEYSALVAAQSLSLEEALPLVATRGRLMEEAFPKGQGTMAAVLGLDEEIIQKELDKIDHEVVDIANLNCPGQIVISGSRAGIDQAEILLKEAGARRVLPLNVSGPFHSRLMKAANEKFQMSLNEVNLKDASVPVYANVTAEPVINKDEINQLLIRQLYTPVRFEAYIRNIISEDVDALVEVGTRKVLSGIVPKTNRKIKTIAVGDAASLSESLLWYKGDA